jgi:hypothetical protein
VGNLMKEARGGRLYRHGPERPDEHRHQFLASSVGATWSPQVPELKPLLILRARCDFAVCTMRHLDGQIMNLPQGQDQSPDRSARVGRAMSAASPDGGPGFDKKNHSLMHPWGRNWTVSRLGGGGACSSPCSIKGRDEKIGVYRLFMLGPGGSPGPMTSWRPIARRHTARFDREIQ